jgi:hypothetical protein
MAPARMRKIVGNFLGRDLLGVDLDVVQLNFPDHTMNSSRGAQHAITFIVFRLRTNSSSEETYIELELGPMRWTADKL